VGAPGNVTPPFDNVIKAAQRNEQQGYDAIWWYDHLMSWWPQSIWTPDLVPPAKLQANPHIHLDTIATIGAVGVQTERVMLGTSVTDAVRRSPAMLAQEFLTLDHITKGRVILGIGTGEACNATPYGIEYGTMQAFAEGFEILHAKKELNYKLPQVAEAWRYGTVIRSWLLDLAAANRRMLEGAGLDPAAIHDAGLCTRCRPALFYSHRGQGPTTGRMMNAILLTA